MAAGSATLAGFPMRERRGRRAVGSMAMTGVVAEGGS
jgi:hypothetical protein